MSRLVVPPLEEAIVPAESCGLSLEVVEVPGNKEWMTLNDGQNS